MGSLTSEKTCDSFGYESNRKITRGNSIIENLDVKFDSNTDNLLSRKRNSKPQEIFGYDNLDRLISVKSGSATAMNITYAPNGNILSKTGIGNYTYNSGFKPHAVMTVDNAEGVIPADALTTSFNDFG
jgi:YD repeat-containing protein